MRSVLAFLSAVALLGVAGAAVWFSGDPCLWRCGAQTECKARRCVAVGSGGGAAPVAVTPTTKRGRRRGGATSGSEVGGTAPEAQLKPGDEKMVTVGDALGRTERVDFSQPDAKELSPEQIDSGFAAASPAIEACITNAVGDAPLERARVVVGARIEASGSVSKLRTEAPALLQQRGLHACIKSALKAHPFPSSGGGSVVTYPFALN